MSSAEIVYTELDSPLGDMISGASPNGICFLEWHDRGGVERILERVKKRYRAEVVEATSDIPVLEQLKIELAEYFDGRRSEFTVPLDPRGTEFERKVWDQLLKIKCGETLSYGEMARLLDRPGGARAIGRANGSNYISILIPCHRVIETGGGLGGYGGKIWRKKRLLELEASQTAIAL